MAKIIVALLGVLAIVSGEVFLVYHADNDPRALSIYHPMVYGGAVLIAIAISMHLVDAFKNPPRPDPDNRPPV
jgi:hypothetical protein